MMLGYEVVGLPERGHSAGWLVNFGETYMNKTGIITTVANKTGLKQADVAGAIDCDLSTIIETIRVPTVRELLSRRCRYSRIGPGFF